MPFSFLLLSLFSNTLVIERGLRRKKTRSSAGVFQYAETVESCVWKDEKFQKDIQVSPRTPDHSKLLMREHIG